MPWAFVFILAACMLQDLISLHHSLHFLARPAVFRILVPWPGIEPMSPAVEGWSPNHWRAGEVPTPSCLTAYYPSARDLFWGRVVWPPSRALLGLALVLSFSPLHSCCPLLFLLQSLFLSLSHSPLLAACFLSSPSSFSLSTPSLYPQLLCLFLFLLLLLPSILSPSHRFSLCLSAC